MYGVMQYHCGHEYRWIFKAAVIRKELELKKEEKIEDISGEEVLWPMGGSNSSATWFCKLDSMEKAKNFLESPGDGPDLEDPELVDLAEYLVTVETDCNSCTQEVLDKFNLNEEDLVQTDDENERYSKAEKMIKALEAAGYADFDYNDPFYGENRDMRYSDLCELYESVTGMDAE